MAKDIEPSCDNCTHKLMCVWKETIDTDVRTIPPRPGSDRSWAYLLGDEIYQAIAYNCEHYRPR